MKKNYSYTYLTPLLGEQVYFDKQILKHIKNTYLFSTKHVQGNLFFILCNFNYRDPEFSSIESRLISSNLFMESHDIGEDVLYVFKFPDEYSSEYLNFIQGRYSKLNDDAKKIILNFWSTFYGSVPSFVTTTLLKIKQVLYKDKKLKEKLEAQLSSEGHPVILSDDAELGNKIRVESEQFEFPESKEISLENIKKLFNIE
ncbi:hypothetical protein N356_gp044 [Cellulophaga phage phi14:2]|uniref:Uncharacterized protein n=1 Tax=Cellulophaga phage phi14:2 TaxID=1327990 RepID=S0A0N6_9CAUD|nr:hypothetical protein N356_gp044 [Cellulophaga phage phi14:2]AGO48936.1 hypothetical protein Phi14:2_gp058 [Cellulophaga phage phi14:2]